MSSLRGLLRSRLARRRVLPKRCAPLMVKPCRRARPTFSTVLKSSVTWIRFLMRVW
ncbi:Uncharacterised protein [Bordetella pertussis]|nr:Uncharacterised protein [Bordetella pertussis]